MPRSRRIATLAATVAAFAAPASAHAIEPNPSPAPRTARVGIAPLPSPMPRPDSKMGHLSHEAFGIIVVCLREL